MDYKKDLKIKVKDVVQDIKVLDYKTNLKSHKTETKDIITKTSRKTPVKLFEKVKDTTKKAYSLGEKSYSLSKKVGINVIELGEDKELDDETELIKSTSILGVRKTTQATKTALNVTMSKTARANDVNKLKNKKREQHWLNKAGVTTSKFSIKTIKNSAIKMGKTIVEIGSGSNDEDRPENTIKNIKDSFGNVKSKKQGYTWQVKKAKRQQAKRRIARTNVLKKIKNFTTNPWTKIIKSKTTDVVINIVSMLKKSKLLIFCLPLVLILTLVILFTGASMNSAPNTQGENLYNEINKQLELIKTSPDKFLDADNPYRHIPVGTVSVSNVPDFKEVIAVFLSRYNLQYQDLISKETMTEENKDKVGTIVKDFHVISVKSDTSGEVALYDVKGKTMEEMFSFYDFNSSQRNNSKKIIELLENMSSASFVMPTVSTTITSSFGWRIFPVDPSRNDFHTGIDFSANFDDPIFAVANGIVVDVAYPFPNQKYGGSDTGAANYIIIDHGNGIKTAYWHLKRVDVSVGDMVMQGQVIGGAGSTGWSTGCHLHFEVRNYNLPQLDGAWDHQVDPYPYLFGGN